MSDLQFLNFLEFWIFCNCTSPSPTSTCIKIVIENQEMKLTHSVHRFLIAHWPKLSIYNVKILKFKFFRLGNYLGRLGDKNSLVFVGRLINRQKMKIDHSVHRFLVAPSPGLPKYTFKILKFNFHRLGNFGSRKGRVKQ